MNRKFLACEAGVSIKPGAQAPGLSQTKCIEPTEWATALSPAFAGSIA